ncbi:MauE/DoxX family redox-associated membrane protein [Microbispora sp. H10949]|uniref:MauE/DoxX family redox-associated membrane protein n=1 Tax=Microbispora sp. H10949 TaxID=2729111 RepID=UPI001604346E|nr:MauE/DoxX family redox-associated membrane protein [Microbispora sp. H10949]
MTFPQHAVQVLLIAIFTVSASGKARDPGSFARSLEALRVVPRAAVLPVAWAVVLAEGVTAVLLAASFARAWLAPYGLVLAAALLAVLTAGLVVALRSGRRARCHCFGRSGAVVGRRHVVRNLLLAAAALAVAPGEPAGFAPTGWFALAVLTGLAAAVLVIAMDDIVSLVTPVTDAGR